MRKGIATLLLLAGLGMGVPVTGQPARFSAEEIRFLVRQTFFEGVPVDLVQAFPREIALPILREMLDSPTEAASWANAAGMLGVIGEAQDARRLIAVAERPAPAGADPATVERARASAIVGLGYLAGATRSREAVDYLVRGLDPGAWTARGAAAPGAADREQAAQLSAIALGLSGDARARAALETAGRANPLFRAGSAAETLREALGNNRRIASEGLLRFYRLEERPTLERYPPGRVLPPLAALEGRPGAPPAAAEAAPFESRALPVPGQGAGPVRAPGRSAALPVPAGGGLIPNPTDGPR